MFDVHGRIKCGTIATPDFNGSLADWSDGLQLDVVADTKVNADLAESWGTPRLLGARTALLAPKSGVPVYIRLVEQPAVLAHLPLRTFGWASFEIAVRDVLSLRRRLDGSRFRIIAEPDAGALPMQVTGRAGEVLYLNEVRESPADYDLPLAMSDVDQMFMAILAAPDRAAATRFHVDALGLQEGETYVLAYPAINAAFGLAPDHKSSVTMTRAGRMPVTEVDEYPPAATPRMRLPNYLPPGNAIVSLSVASLDRINAPFLSPPVSLDEPLYAGRRTAMTVGAAGELIELIEIG